MEQQPKGILPGSTQPNTMPCVKQRIFYTVKVYRLYQSLLLEDGTPEETFLTNRRIPDRYVRWCERTGSQLMATFLLDVRQACVSAIR